MVIADVCLLIPRKALHEKRSISRAKQEKHTEAGPTSIARPGDPLLDDATAQIGVDPSVALSVPYRRAQSGIGLPPPWRTVRTACS